MKTFDILDILSPRPKLYVNSHKRYITLIGIFISSLYQLRHFDSLLLHRFLLLFIYHFTTEEVSSDFSFDLKQNLFSFYFMNVTGSGAVDPRVASIVPTLYTYNKTKSTITQLDMEPCQYDKHFSKKMYKPLMKGINVSEYSCISNNTKNLSLIYNRTEQSGQYIILYMRTCVNSTENNNFCYTKNEIDNALTNSIFYFSYLVGSISIDHYNNSDPFRPSVYTQDIRMSYTSRSDLNIFWKPVLYKTDNGWIFEKNRMKNYFQIDENSFRQTMATDKQKYSIKNSFSKTLFGLHYSTIDNYKRTYPKIQSVIANCSGLIQVSFQIAKFIVHMFTLGEYYSFLFDFDFNTSITINSVNNSVNNESKVELKKQGNANISFGRSKVKS